jgi:hypothetical protein
MVLKRSRYTIYHIYQEARKWWIKHVLHFHLHEDDTIDKKILLNKLKF